MYNGTFVIGIRPSTALRGDHLRRWLRSRTGRRTAVSEQCSVFRTAGWPVPRFGHPAAGWQSDRNPGTTSGHAGRATNRATWPMVQGTGSCWPTPWPTGERGCDPRAAVMGSGRRRPGPGAPGPGRAGPRARSSTLLAGRR